LRQEISGRVLFHQLVPASLRLQYQLADLADSAEAAGESCDVVCGGARVAARVGDCYGEHSAAHERDVNNVVADEGDFRRPNTRLREKLLERRELVACALPDVRDAEVCGAHGDEL